LASAILIPSSATAVHRRLVTIAVLGLDRRFDLGVCLLHLELRLLPFLVGDIALAVHRVQLAQGRPLLALGDLDVAAGVEYRRALARWNVVHRRIIDLVAEAAAARGAEQGSRRDRDDQTQVPPGECRPKQAHGASW